MDAAVSNALMGTTDAQPVSEATVSMWRLFPAELVGTMARAATTQTPARTIMSQRAEAPHGPNVTALISSLAEA